MKFFEDVERRIDSAVRELFRGGSKGDTRELFEIQKGILEDALARLERLPRARLLFPYRTMRVRIALPSEERRATYEAVFAADVLRQELLGALKEDGAEFAPELIVSVEVLEPGADLGPNGFLVTYGTAPTTISEVDETKPNPKVRLKVLEAGPEVDLRKQRIHLGRTADVQDAQLRVIRKNDLAINDPSVSRAHAHLRW
ncbi:MAG TPA: FHA domain-containing protein, partial [Bryobacteraceae bacterium]|nr:FHA domain-containing protein [Bryobacteraceae bacterium]